MERQITLLADSVVDAYLQEAVHPDCTDIHVILHQGLQAFGLQAAQQLLNLQMQSQCPVELICTPAPRDNVMFMASLLGRYSKRYPEAAFTLVGYHQSAEELAELGLESGQIVYFHGVEANTDEQRPVTQSARSSSKAESTKDKTKAVDSSKKEQQKSVVELKAELPTPTETAEVAPVAEVTATPEQHVGAEEEHHQPTLDEMLALTEAIPDAPGTEPTEATAEPEEKIEEVHVEAMQTAEPKKMTEIGLMIQQKEERKKKNEQIINALMKKVSDFPYKLSDSKPVSGVMKEQVIENDGKEKPVDKAM